MSLAMLIEEPPAAPAAVPVPPADAHHLAWLEAELPQGATLLDYGCGSGILAIAARKLGAGPTLAVWVN